MTQRVSLTELTRPKPGGINDPCLKMPVIPGGRWTPDGSKMLALEVFIMMKPACEAELEELANH